MNPKARVGALKVPMSLLPAIARVEGAMAMRDGAQKYGPYNWRDEQVDVMTYLDALDRHVVSFLDGENVDPVSGVTHLGHAIACIAIILDGLSSGNIIDNRPQVAPTARAIRGYNDQIKAKAQPAPEGSATETSLFHGIGREQDAAPKPRPPLDRS